jgi:hypothetical protein
LLAAASLQSAVGDTHRLIIDAYFSYRGLPVGTVRFARSPASARFAAGHLEGVRRLS